MKKLTLEIDALTVESFDTGDDGHARRGTVQAREESGFPAPNIPTHAGDTCDGVATCNRAATCETSCANGPMCDCAVVFISVDLCWD